MRSASAVTDVNYRRGASFPESAHRSHNEMRAAHELALIAKRDVRRMCDMGDPVVEVLRIAWSDQDCAYQDLRR